MTGPRRHFAVLIATGLVACLGLGLHTAVAQQLPPAALIRMGPAGKPEVVPSYWQQPPQFGPGGGLLIWTQWGRETWRVYPSSQSATRTPQGASTLAMASRVGGPGWGSPGGTGPAANLLTVQLEQLIGQVVVRGEGFLTPGHGAYHLDPRITIRRQPGDGPQPYPATTLCLRQGGDVLVKIPVEEDQAKIAWSEIPRLPGRLQEGLPPGEYTLMEEDGSPSVTFFVEETAIRKWVMEIPDELAQWLDTREHPLYLQVAAGHLLAQRDEDDRPRPYAADALDLLEAAPPEILTPYLNELRGDVLARLEGEPSSEPPASALADADATGIAPIDAARRLILVGDWDAALGQLESPELADSPRSRALATLYRAVILAESGPATEGAARALFAQAIEQLEDHPSDAYRARNNYANALLTSAQDRLYNHAFQIASGVPYALICALMDWRESLFQYESAMDLAAGLTPGDRAAVQVNIARLYALLADVIRTLDPPVGGRRGFAQGEAAAADHARGLATAVLAQTSEESDRLVRAASHEILAQLAFRSGDAPTCRKEVEQAIGDYLHAGALAGVESGHRTLGLLHLRQAEASEDPTAAEAARKQALRHLMLSHILSETLREQIPADQIGLSRAGFFARRAYVNEQICRLLIAEGKPAEALRYAELAKARALGDVLALAVDGSADGTLEPRDLSEILADWPEDVAAVEYFLGTEEAWLFLIDTSGSVTARVLEDGRGRPLSSRDLVARVRSFLARIDHQADQMRRRLDAGMGYDHTWQYELHDFYRQLLPKGVLKKLRTAETVLVVPHHILHYFPLAALVTQPDTAQRTRDEMAKPRFLLDEPFDLCYVPSLAAWDLLREARDRPIRQVAASGIVEFERAQPLPGVRKDLANLKATFGERVRTVLSDQEASETRARGIFNRTGLMFLATHGKNFADQPLSSYLMFRADEKNDGYLTAGELYSIDVAADLVVMSACYSGLAERSPLPGDDLFGLQRALLHAGARTVVCGMWDVYDGTGPELMQGFFEGLAEGQPAPAALADSQRALLDRLRESEEVEPWLHPYFWAVYTTIGDDRTHVETGAE
jgi:CHAT domain-containing protein